MSKGRVETFSDAVIAIAMTIMVLELRAPPAPDLQALTPLIPQFLGCALSFTFLGIYWNIHHHMFQVVHTVDGRILWANLHLLFWLSLIPFVTGWMGESSLALYALAIPLAFVSPSMAVLVYVVVAIMWLVPDRRIEKRIAP